MRHPVPPAVRYPGFHRARLWTVGLGVAVLVTAASFSRGQEPATLTRPGVIRDYTTEEPPLANPFTLFPRPTAVPGAVVPAQAVEGPPPRVLPQMADPILEQVVEPDRFLDLVVGIPRLLVLKRAPKRIQLGGGEKDAVAGFTVVSEREISVVGHRVGRTALTLWFTDPADPTKQQIVSYLVRVQPDELGRRTAQEQLQRHVKDLEAQINRAFPDSRVCLTLVGSTVLLSGQAHDVAEATQISQIIGPRRGGQAGTRTNQGATVIQHGLAETRVEQVQQERVDPAAPAFTPLGPLPHDLDDPNGAASLLRGLAIVNQLRVPGEQQVMLKVVVAEVNRTALRELGVNFAISNESGLVFAQTTGGLLQINNTGGGGTSGTIGGNLPIRLDNGNVAIAIQALKQQNLARSLAEPNLVALNGQTASFQAGGQFPVPVVTGFTAAGLQGVSFVPFGVQLNFTPQISDKDRVRLVIGADVSTRDVATGASVGGANVPGLNTRNFQTTVEMREGQTLAVAGLLQNNYGADASRVPFFGELPLIGRAFGRQRATAGEQELLVLVTPVLVRPAEKCWRPLPGSDLFEPTDSEFYLHGRLESNYPNDFRSPIRTDIHRTLNGARGGTQPAIVPPYGTPPPAPAPGPAGPAPAPAIGPVPNR